MALIVTSDKSGRILTANQKFCETFGWKRNELIGQNVAILMPRTYAQQHDSYIGRYNTTHAPKVVDKSRLVECLHHSTGLIFQARLRLSVIPFENSDHEGIFAANFEVLPERQVKIIVDRELKLVSVDTINPEFLGYPKDFLRGKSLRLLIPSLQGDRNASAAQIYEENKLDANRTVIAINRFGIEVPLSITMEPTSSHSLPSVTSSMSSSGSSNPSQSISSSLTYKIIAVAIDDEMESVLTVSEAGIIQSVNQTTTDLFGFSESELIGFNINVIMPSPERYMHDLYLKRYRETGVPHIVGSGPRHLSARHRDGTVFPIRLEVEEFQLDGEKMFRGMIRRSTNWRKRSQSLSNKYQATDEEIQSQFPSALLGYYTIGEFLGQGYFGKVRAATHILTGEKVAVKTLSQAQYNELGLEYPPRELRILKAVQPHPNICQLLDVIDAGERIYLIQEFIAGEELFDYAARKGSLKETESRDIFRQLLSAVSYLHDHGIVHRDIKLENILLATASRTVKLIDLGLSDFYAKDRQLHEFCGTSNYAAPELLYGTPYTGPEVDIWALGVVVYILCSGHYPFPTPRDTVKCNPYYPPAFSQPLVVLLRKIFQMAKDRADLNTLLHHPWTTLGYESMAIEMTFVSKKDVIEVDEELLKELDNIGWDGALMKNSILSNEHNQMTATYYLAKRRWQQDKQQDKSRCEIS